MKLFAVVMTLVVSLLFAPTHSEARSATFRPHGQPQAVCVNLKIFQQSANYFHETIYDTLYEQQTGAPCTPDGSYFAQGQIDFSGNQSHVGTIYTVLLETPSGFPKPFNQLALGYVTYSPSTNVVDTSVTAANSCLKVATYFDQNGLGFTSTATNIC